MLSTQTQLDLAFDSEEWKSPSIAPRLYRAASVGSWGVTSIGRGFDWDENDDLEIHQLKITPEKQEQASPREREPVRQGHYSENRQLDRHAQYDQLESSISRKSPVPPPSTSSATSDPTKVMRLVTNVTPKSAFFSEPFYMSPMHSRSPSPSMSSSSTRPIPGRSPSTPRPRRRSSQQRVSLIAGRVSIAPADSPTIVAPNFQRASSASSLLSAAASTRAPSPTNEESFLGSKRITDFDIEGEIGRGAYGLVKRGRETLPDGSLGPPVVIKSIIKSRILADCWKKHPKLGTIPIEIYVMSAISNTSYVLPPRRPWDPSRFNTESKDEDDWIEGKVIKGHPNICPLLDFFEDSHYYYIVLPCTTPDARPNEPQPSSDLFDLVESFPNGLPPRDIRTYLGQIADALTFLHAHGIVHRDVKDENVVLGAGGRGILIDFGSAGLIKKSGWDSFSGTLDYAGPEILRGERYQGKEQDVWAFGVVAYVLLVGECPFMTAAEAQEGLTSPFANAAISLDERCADGKEDEGEEPDGGGALGDAAALVRACLQVEVSARPTFEKILQSRFLAGNGGWGMERPL
ncbi:serine/threonine protein kinase [Marasmius crinis-equi]|uniref:Serine/threonine protein kinase n=1 Tax=Marasmius crinis-equi TaxID=585013 RepID=A0ABR3FYB9_9AGAR